MKQGRYWKVWLRITVGWWRWER